MTTPEFPTSICAVTGCQDQPFLLHPIPLCRRDALTISINVTDLLHANALMGHQGNGGPIDAADIAADDVWGQPSHPPVVYFLANGDRIKIGVSTNISARVGALSLRKANAQLLLRGGFDLEAALHKHFAADRIGATEWFAQSDRIRSYIAAKKEAGFLLRQPKVTDDEDKVVSVIATPRRSAMSASTKIVDALRKMASLPGPNAIYRHKDDIAKLTGLKGSTLDNTLSGLVKDSQIHRQIEDGREVRGMYGLGAGQ